ncbi:MAG: BrxA/BrxB family bacilliredoxin [Sphingobacteriaceae bacterium]|nr:BrxA/BrxB family bacilliredoxin [Sphingobacteriaceae bacterium]
MAYPEFMVAPMRKDLTEVGFNELKTAEEVEQLLSNKSGTTLVVVNSVCGCAAANARPAVKKAIQNAKKPAVLSTVFAGMETDAVNKARAYMLPYPPSSPAIALFKDGQLVHMLERHHIEGRSADMIAANLVEAFDQHC